MTQAGEVLSPSILLLFIPQTCNKSYELVNDCDEVITASCTWGYNASDVGFYSLRVKETRADLFFNFLAWQQHASVIFSSSILFWGKSFLCCVQGRVETVGLTVSENIRFSWYHGDCFTHLLLLEKGYFFMFIIISQNIMPLYFFNNVCNNTFIFSIVGERLTWYDSSFHNVVLRFD